MSELNEEVQVTVNDAPVATVPLVENFTADNAAPKASFVGSALDEKADIATIMNYVTISVDGQQSDNQGVILLYGDDIPIDDTNNAPTVKAAIAAVDAKGAADIAYGLNVSVKDKIDDVISTVGTIQSAMYGDEIPIDSGTGAQSIKAAISAVDAKTANTIIYANATTIKSKVDGIETSLGTVQTAVNNAVKVTSQSLTDAEKLQARTNIGAAAAAEFVSVNSQSFTTTQQTQARTNIAALGASDVADVVRTSEQTLSSTQQSQARANIGAASSSALGGALKVTSTAYTLPADVAANDTVTITQTELAVTPPEGYSLIGVIRYDIGNKALVATSMSASAIGNIYIQLTNRTSSPAGYLSVFNVQFLWVKSDLLS